MIPAKEIWCELYNCDSPLFLRSNADPTSWPQPEALYDAPLLYTQEETPCKSPRLSLYAGRLLIRRIGGGSWLKRAAIEMRTGNVSRRAS